MELNIIWFVLIVVLFAGYVVLDGFDLGVGMTHFVAKNDTEKRLMINSIGPVWDGNEVWLITAGGALFAAFPDVYATVFSGFYTAFMLFLAVIIGRAVSIEFRSKVESVSWRHFWDNVFNASSYLIVVLLGVTLGNLIAGVPVDEYKQYAGDFWTLIHPYPIFLALTAVVTLRLHGKIYLAIKTEGDLQSRIAGKINRSLILFIVFYVALTIWTLTAYPYMLDNFSNFIWYIFPLLVILSIVMIPIMMKKKKYFRAFIFSSLIILSSISLVGVGLFPNLLLSSPILENSLTIENSSSDKTLWIMFIIACIGVPLVLVYSFFVYRIFGGKVKLDSHSY